MLPRVFLADLRYDYSGVLSNDTFPLGVGYMKAVMDKELPEVQSRLFSYPAALLEAIQQEAPDVLMLSNYSWNESLSLHFAKIFKRLKPDGLVVMGGPNVQVEPERQLEWFGSHTELDVYVLGEGDFLATEVTKSFLDAGLSLQRFRGMSIASSLHRQSDGAPVRSEMRPRHREIDEIPSPYLTGVLDESFDGRLAPLLETNRGCPFACTFCCQGTGWYTKVHHFSVERLREEIFYIAKKVVERCPEVTALKLADSNYGMFERDVEISGILGETQRLYRWPTFIDATTGKNRPDRIIQSMEKVGGAMLLYQSVQSLDEQVLKNVKRGTIKLEAYDALQVYVRGRGMRSNSDLILGLPGETLQSHATALRKLLDAGISQTHNFQLMMLKGTELESKQSRDQFKFRSGWRVLPRNFGEYAGEKVFEIEEIICETETLPFQDYLKARLMALACVAFWGHNRFDDVISFAQHFGMKRSQWLDMSVETMNQAGGELRKFCDDFLADTANELFPTREACEDFYSSGENFERLKRGEIGGNLLFTCRANSMFALWPVICDAGMNALRKFIESSPGGSGLKDFREFWSNLTRWMKLRYVHGTSSRELLQSIEAEFTYDINAWLSAGTPEDFGAFRLSEPQPVRFRLSSDSERDLTAALHVYTDGVSGLSKMLSRIQIGRLIRHTEIVGRLSTAVHTASCQN
jgi:radical SAM superfamily enzyme YgiQ (UPF0313 family)